MTGSPNINASYNTLGFLSPLLKCINPEARDMTETICSCDNLVECNVTLPCHLSLTSF